MVLNQRKLDQRMLGKNRDVVGEFGIAPRSCPKIQPTTFCDLDTWERLFYFPLSLYAAAGVSGCGLRAWRIAGAICAFMVLGDK